MFRLLLAAAFLVSVSGALLADGTGHSVGFSDDAEPFLRKNPELLDLIKRSFDVEPIGWAQNGGKTFSNPTAATRLLPYGFRAKPKGFDGPYTVLLLIEENASGAEKGVVLTIVPLSQTATSASPSGN